MTNDQQLDQEHHRIKGYPESEKPAPMHKDSWVIPYSPLPQEILRADGTCHVTMFTAGISTVLNAFIQQENACDRSAHLTEREWLERFTKFVEDLGGQRKKF
jgi:hypothetical protein